MKNIVSKIFVFALAILVVVSATGCGSTATETSAVAPADTAIEQAAVIPVRDGPGGSSTFASVAPTHADLAYATVSAAQKLDIYLPMTGPGPFPLVIMVHGGGFMFGDKADGGGLIGVDALLAAGYAVASINYRLSGEAQYPAQINDAKAAVRFLRANAGEYNLNPEKFGAWGASAGGNLVSLLGTTCGVAELEGAELGNADQSSCVQAVVDWFGPIDFLKMQEQLTDAGCSASTEDASSPESKLIGAPIQTVPEKVALTNPMNYITADDAPFLIENGTADCNIPPIQNKNLAGALSAVLGADQVTYVSLEGAGHGGGQFETTENLAQVIAFLDKYLK
ncbi:MAG: alpha/beta hydrolase [Anaerolineae bacterium]|nr:alpha/beta hydrolase [Anaerolineae bacterium]